MSGYDYGNTRLRARRAALLRRDHYHGMLGRDLPGLLAALAATSYRPQAEAVALRPGGQLAQLYQAADDHLAAALTGISSYYRGRAHNVVTALLGRFDLEAVLALLRAAHHGTLPSGAGALPPPVARLDTATARLAAREPDLPAAARFLAARRLPDPDSAGALLTAQRRYEIDTDLARLEETVARAARGHQLRVLTAAGPPAAPAAAALRRETDDRNLLLALRLREPGTNRSGGTASEHAGAYLPGGTVPLPLFNAIQRIAERAQVVPAATQARPAWHDALADWAVGGSLAALHARLDTERLRTDLRLLARADPLGPAPVLHHVRAHQAQARNLRLLAQAAAGAVSHEEARRQLVPPI
jgi:vacuolar-type H+-ATPase subunit C/Vma6